MKRLFVAFAVVLNLLSPAVHAERAVTVFAAASLSGVLEEIARDTSQQVTLSYGGSGAIARQVATGAPADLVILASPKWMAWLVAQRAVARGTDVVIAENGLVVIGAAGTLPPEDPIDLIALLDGGRLAMGQRDAVPAGSYARQWLASVGLWAALAPRLAETGNVRAALALVARGETPIGIVYASDAQAEPRVDVLYTIPADAHDPIQYPAAALTEAGAAFLAYLKGPKAARVFATHGFARPAP